MDAKIHKGYGDIIIESEGLRVSFDASEDNIGVLIQLLEEWEEFNNK